MYGTCGLGLIKSLKYQCLTLCSHFREVHGEVFFIKNYFVEKSSQCELVEKLIK